MLEECRGWYRVVVQSSELLDVVVVSGWTGNLAYRAQSSGTNIISLFVFGRCVCPLVHI